MKEASRVPGQKLPVRIPPDDAVGQDILRCLKTPHSAFRQGAENAVGLQLSESGPVQRKLQKLHAGAPAPHSQQSHAIPPIHVSIHYMRDARKT